MKKTRRMDFKLVVAIALALIILSSTLVSAGSIVDVKGYLREGASQEEIKEAPAQFSVSNVTKVHTLNKPWQMSRLDVKSPSTITLKDQPFMFDVYKATLDENGYPEYDETDPIRIGDGESALALDLEIGDSLELTDPGYYYIIFRYGAISGSTEAIIKVAAEPTLARVANPKTLIDGNPVEFGAYNINDRNYFKLRDLAKALTPSKKQFDVCWNNDKKIIELFSNKPYTAIGGELEKTSGLDKLGLPNMSKIYIDGEEIDLLAYNIDGNNYFKLRDLGEVFDFEVDWDEKTKTVLINTEN